MQRANATRTGWYVTHLAGDMNDLLDGPFNTRDECIMRCLARSSETTIIRAHYTGRVVLLYTPRYVKAHVNARASEANRPGIDRAQRAQSISTESVAARRPQQQQTSSSLTSTDDSGRDVSQIRPVLHASRMGRTRNDTAPQVDLEGLTHSQLNFLALGLGITLTSKPNRAELKAIIITYLATGK